MALDKLVDSTQLDADLTSVADAIRAKSGGSSQLAFPADFLTEIAAISGGGGQTVTLLASGTYVLAADATAGQFNIPVSFTGTPIYSLVAVASELESTAQTVVNYLAYNFPNYEVFGREYFGSMRYRAANGSYGYSIILDNCLSNQNYLMVKRSASSYPLKANTYNWEIWGYAE